MLKGLRGCDVRRQSRFFFRLFFTHFISYIMEKSLFKFFFYDKDYNLMYTRHYLFVDRAAAQRHCNLLRQNNGRYDFHYCSFDPAVDTRVSVTQKKESTLVPNMTKNPLI